MLFCGLSRATVAFSARSVRSSVRPSSRRRAVARALLHRLHDLMLGVGAQALVLGGTLSAAASVAHLACIALGAPAYRFMGASGRMARAVEAGGTRPTLITLT